LHAGDVPLAPVGRTVDDAGRSFSFAGTLTLPAARRRMGAPSPKTQTMSFRFEFDSKQKILLIRFEGRATDEMIENYYRVVGPKVVATLEFRGSIVDFTDVTSMELTPKLVRVLAWSSPLDTQVERPRVIVAPTANAFGLARMFALHGEETRPSLHVVRTMQEAYALLGVVNCEFKPLE
jgi:hypothetical protein